ncbi:MAG: hypothetical protein JXA03_15540 [Bacteroidales bacterium]|nr:hypothetical protein [Bacteroidales bacterium]
MKISEYFILKEFIDPAIYAARGDKSIELIDSRLIDIAMYFRLYFGEPVIINNWHTGGGYKESGLRSFTTKTGAFYSQHKYGRAIDMKFIGVQASDVIAEVQRKWRKFRSCGMTTMETGTPTWVHVDCRQTGQNDLYLVPFTT